MQKRIFFTIIFGVVILCSFTFLSNVYAVNFLVQTSDTIDGKTLTDMGIAHINNNGDLVTIASGFSGGSGIFTSDSLIVAIGDTIDGKTLTHFGSSPSTNDDNEIVFHGIFSGGEGIFTPDSLLVATGDIIDGKTLTGFSYPQINNNGDIVYFATFSGGHGIFTPDSLLVATGDIIDGKTLTFALSPSLNDNNEIVFHGVFSGGHGIFTPDSLLVATGDIIDGQIIYGPYSARISDNDDVVFIDSNYSRIFTLDNLIIAAGDFLDNVMITGVFFPEINEKGDIVFAAYTSSGSAILFEATSQLPVDATLNLIETIEDLVDNKKDSKNLIKILDDVLKELDKGHTNHASKELGKFINDVNKLVMKGKLAPSDANILIESAQSIEDTLSVVPTPNSPPTIDNVTFIPVNPKAGLGAVCVPNGVADVDGDVVSVSYSWIQFGNVISTERIIPLFVSQIGPITCEVIPFDGTDFGVPVSQTIVLESGDGGGI